MPITQVRMLALLEAAEDFRTALYEAERTTAEALRALTSGLGDPLGQLQILHATISANILLSKPLTSESTILLERAHFRREARRNDRARARQRRRRGTPSALPSPSSPPSLDELLRQQEETFAPALDISALDDKGTALEEARDTMPHPRNTR